MEEKDILGIGGIAANDEKTNSSIIIFQGISELGCEKSLRNCPYPKIFLMFPIVTDKFLFSDILYTCYRNRTHLEIIENCVNENHRSHEIYYELCINIFQSTDNVFTSHVKYAHIYRRTDKTFYISWIKNPRNSENYA